MKKALRPIKKSVTVARDAIREVGAALLAINLYPFGVIERQREGKKHSEFTHNPLPIILVHGVFHNHSAFVALKRRMENLGWENLFTLNYKTSHGNVLKMTEDLAHRVDDILKRTGAKQVDIVAHSLGGIVARAFMSIGQGRGKVRRLVTLGTPHQGTVMSFLAKGWSLGALNYDLSHDSFLIRLLSTTALPRESKIISIFSNFDWTVVPARYGAARGIPHSQFVNVELSNIGHMGLLYSGRAFDEIVRAITTDSQTS